MTTTEPVYEARECGCRYEVIEPGKRWRITQSNRCEQHQRERIIDSDAMSAIDNLLWRCTYEGDERAKWLQYAADHLQAAADNPEEWS